MFNFQKQKKQQKILICLLFFGLFVFGLLLLSSDKFDISNALYYNKGKEILAAEEKPINCRKQAEIQLPFGITAQFGPNEFEIPTGQVTDRTEDAARRILEQLSILIGAAEQENAEAREIINLAGQCGISRCTTPGCALRYFDCEPCLAWSPYDITTCVQWSRCSECPPPPPCGGQACPDGINDRLERITTQKNIISSASNMIRNILTDEPRNKPVGYWWLPICPGTPGCINERDFILDELERARSGNYKIFFGETIRGCERGWECRPPGLEGCVNRPEDIEKIIEGEKTGKYLFSCKEAIIAGVMNSFDEQEKPTCYGYRETESESNQAENYYCCE